MDHTCSTARGGTRRLLRQRGFAVRRPAHKGREAALECGSLPTATRWTSGSARAAMTASFWTGTPQFLERGSRSKLCKASWS